MPASRGANRAARRAREHEGARRAILDAARRLAARAGPGHLSIRGVAAEAGYAPAALYGYFRNRGELVIALAADDLASLAHEIRDAAPAGEARLSVAAHAVLAYLSRAESLRSSIDALDAEARSDDVERLFNGRMISALTALSETLGGRPAERAQQCDVLLVASALMGLAVLLRSGRLKALGFSADELIVRMNARFGAEP